MSVGRTKRRVNRINLNGCCSWCSVPFGWIFNIFYVVPAALAVDRVEFKQQLSSIEHHYPPNNNSVLQQTLQRFKSVLSWSFYTANEGGKNWTALNVNLQIFVFPWYCNLLYLNFQIVDVKYFTLRLAFLKTNNVLPMSINPPLCIQYMCVLL